MRVLDIRHRFKLIWLILPVPFLILLAACGSGVPQEEFDAEQARVQGLEVQVQGLQQRLDRGLAITEVLDTLTSSFEEGPSAEAILQVTALIHASGDPQLDAKWEEIGESVGSEPPSQEALNAMGAAVQASGIPKVAEKWQEVVAALQNDEGAAEFLEFAALARASGDPALQAAIIEISEASSGRGNPPPELYAEFEALVEAWGNAQIQEAVKRLGEPSPEVIEEIRAKLETIGNPSLEALFEAAYESAGEELEAFFDGMFTVLKETLQ